VGVREAVGVFVTASFSKYWWLAHRSWRAYHRQISSMLAFKIRKGKT